jgi:hypothetical protein
LKDKEIFLFVLLAAVFLEVYILTELVKGMSTLTSLLRDIHSTLIAIDTRAESIETNTSEMVEKLDPDL